jgi:hypothetical protein
VILCDGFCCCKIALNFRFFKGLSLFSTPDLYEKNAGNSGKKWKL